MARPTRYTEEMFTEYRKKGYWEATTLSDFWDINAGEHPDREAISDSRTSLTWAEAKRWIDRLALGFLELGYEKDDMIVLQLPNRVELGLLRVACERAGLLCLPVLRTWRQREMEYVLARVGAKGVAITRTFRDFDYFQMIEKIHPGLPKLEHVFLVGDEVLERAISIQEMVGRPLEETYPLDTLTKSKCAAEEFSLIAATSGTTGFPKFIESPICSRIYMGKVFIERFGLTENDVIGAFTPAVGGPNHPAYFSAPIVRAKLVMLEHFSPEESLRIIEKERITLCSVVPAQLAMMIADPRRSKYNLSSLRLLHCAGSPLSPRLNMEVEKEMGCPVVQSYGTMDSGGITLHSFRDKAEVRFFTVGKPPDHNEIRLIDDDGKEVSSGSAGEILTRGPALVSGYFRDPETTSQAWTEDGWYKTGDLGRFDEEGNLLIVGRKKDIIIRGGQNIYPVEIENLLLTHPKVSNVAVVRMPDPVMGEKACAYVVPEKGQEFRFEEMIRFLIKSGVAPYKLPERLEVLDALPMVPGVEKVDKKNLEEDIKQKL